MNRLAWLALIALLSPACGGGGPDPDAGDGAPDDGGGDDGGPITLDGGGDDGGGDDGGGDDGHVAPTTLPSCTQPDEVTGDTMVEYDTSSATPGLLSLGEECGNPAAPTPSPQAIVKYTVPGSGETAVSFSAVNSGTDSDFDTVIQVRRGACEDAPTGTFPRSCFDDADPQAGEFRSAGAVQATGGDVLYFIITGFTGTPVEGGTDRGMISVVFSTGANTAPTLATASYTGVRNDSVLTVAGSDAESNVEGFLLTLLDSADAIVDINGDEVGDDADLIVELFGEADGVLGMENFTSTVVLGGGDDLRELGVAKARVAVFDEASAASNEVMVDVTYSGLYGEPCASDDPFCGTGLECSSSMCGASAEVTAACAAATALTVETPTAATTHTSTTGTTIMGGTSNFEGSCADTPGGENIYTVAVPSGAFDLIAGTNVEGTATSADTVVYVRAACENPAESGCNDDIDPDADDRRSSVVVTDAAAGTYAIIVESYAGTTADAYTLQVALRPVLSAGATCDPDEEDNRCANGACPTSSGTAVCP